MRFLILPLGLSLLACSGNFSVDNGDTADEPVVVGPDEGPANVEERANAAPNPRRKPGAKPKARPKPAPVEDGPTPEPEPAPGEAKEPEGIKGVTQTGTRSWSVRERVVDRWKDDPYALASVSEKGEGWELHHVRGRDAFHLGMRNKDVIVSVNGKKLNTQTQLLAAYLALKNKTEFDVVFERNGKRMTHHYVVK